MDHYPLEVFWSEEDAGYIAEAPDLPGCSAFGRDENEAVAEAQDAIASWLEAAKATGREIPQPAAVEPLNAFSGKLVVRFGRTLHAQLARRAQLDGLSLNQYVVRLVSANSAADLVARIPYDIRARTWESIVERHRPDVAATMEQVRRANPALSSEPQPKTVRKAARKRISPKGGKGVNRT